MEHLFFIFYNQVYSSSQLTRGSSPNFSSNIKQIYINILIYGFLMISGEIEAS